MKLKDSTGKEGLSKRIKARFFVKGYHQVKGINFQESLALVLRYDSLRLMITIAEQYAFKLCHLNIKTAWYSILVQGR